MTEQAVMKEKVDRLAELNRQMSVIKGETEQIKAWFENRPWMTCVIQRIRPSNIGGMETRRW